MICHHGFCWRRYPGQHYGVRGQEELSSKQAEGGDSRRVSLPLWHLWHAGHVLLYTKSVLTSASRKVILVSSSVSTAKFHTIPQRFYWLRIGLEIPFVLLVEDLTEVEPHQGHCSAPQRGE